MKNNINYLLFVILLAINTTHSQLTPATEGVWTPLGDTLLQNKTHDPDSGDGVNDGAIYIDGQDTDPLAGASLVVGGTIEGGTPITVEIVCYNTDNSWVTARVEFWNKTDNEAILLPNGVDENDPKWENKAVTWDFGNASEASPGELPARTFNLTTVAADDGDEFEIRFYKQWSYHTARNFSVDYVKVNGVTVSANIGSGPSLPCPTAANPDIPLPTFDASVDAEIDLMVQRFSDDYLGTGGAPSLTSANASYASLNISVVNGNITGNNVGTDNKYKIIKTYAQYLKVNPNDGAVQEKARNLIWLTTKQYCDVTFRITGASSYGYDDFFRPAVLLYSILTPEIIELFRYMFDKETQNDYFWSPTYVGGINTDFIYNYADAQMAYAKWFNTPEERHRQMLGFKRYMERFFSYTDGEYNGIKLDGSGVHHSNAYNNYMYAYKTAANVVHYLKDTKFKVNVDNYKIFRDAVYMQYVQSNDDGVQALSTSGRNPHIRTRQFGSSELKRLAIAGGEILGLATADPILAGLHNSVYGADTVFNYTTETPVGEGFYQVNHAHAGTYRKDNWLTFNRGFTYYSWGAEIYVGRNRYGRYQSYGALEVIYPGSKYSGNGFDVGSWDWRFNPGATTLNIPWTELYAPYTRVDERQQKNFAGSLSFAKKGSEVLTNNYGSYGMFAMDFHEDASYNNNFRFKKSTFYLDDMIVCLGSNISNSNPKETITTLYQRAANKGSVTVNGEPQPGDETYSGASNNWVISNYKTGFYVVSSDATLKVKKEIQKTPNHDQTDPSNDGSSNNPVSHYTGYLDHGISPSNKEYEYIMKPATNTSEMGDLHSTMTGESRPYEVHQKDQNAHILEYKSQNIWGYAFFSAVSNLNYSDVKSVDAQCLLMTKYDGSNTVLVSIVDPDLGFKKNSTSPSTQKVKQVTFNGEWNLKDSYPGVQKISSSATETIIQFTLKDGLSKEIELVNTNTLVSKDFVKDNFSIYPNPMKNILNIRNLLKAKTYAIFDALGKNIRKRQLINGTSINLSDINNGMYFITFYNKNDEKITKKIIISK